MASGDYVWHFDYPRVARDLGFAFQTRRIKSLLDQSIGCVDIDQVIKNRDTATIERLIGTIVEFTLDNDQTSVLDPSFVKIFRISQLAVQYLLFCKKYLDDTVNILKKDFVKYIEEIKNRQRYIDELKHDLAISKKQIKDLKAALNCQIACIQNIPVFQCNECPKAFSTEEYLLAHIKRRHELPNGAVTSFQAETDKLQSEIKQLKERLNNTEKYILNTDESDKLKSSNDFMTMPSFVVNNNTEDNTLLADLQQKFELLKAHVENELRILQTQTFDQEKYEKWFETFLNKLEQSHNVDGKVTNIRNDSIHSEDSEKQTQNCNGKADVDQETQTSTSILKNEFEKNDNATQTDFALERNICKDCQSRAVHQMTEVKPANHQRQGSFNSNESGQIKVHSDTDDQLEKFGEILQEKMTGSIEMLENQMQSFWAKMNEIEKQKLENPKPKLLKHSQNKSDSSLDTIDIKPHKVVPKPKKRIHVVKQALVSSPKEQQNQKLIKISPRPKEILKSTIVKLPKRSLEVVSPKGNNTKSDSDTESKSSEESDSSESSESEEDGEHSERFINMKPSVTSTLGQRSLASLKEVAFTSEVLDGLQKEIENVLDNRLEELGVSPNWTTLPLRSYQRALGIVNHQASLIQKNIFNYKQIRGHILKDLDKKIMEQQKSSAPKDSRLKTLLSNVKVKTKAIINNPEKTSPQVNPQKIKKPESVQSTPVKPRLKMYVTDSESDNNSIINRRNAWNQLKIANQTQKAYDDVIQELNTTVTSKLKHHESTSDVSSEVPIKEPEPRSIVKREVEDENQPDLKVETQAKGVLKNYPSTGSLHKKKVLFDLESPDTSSQKQQEKIPLKANDGSTTSIASSILDGPQPNPEQSEKKQQELSDISDWDLSEILN